MQDLSDLSAQLERYRLDDSIQIRWHTHEREQKIIRIIEILDKMLRMLQTTQSDNDLRKKCASLGIKLNKILEAYRGDALLLDRISLDNDYSVKTINDELNSILGGHSTEVWQVQDISGTDFGRFIAKHINWAIKTALKEAPNINPFTRMLGKGGYVNSMYEKIHLPLDATPSNLYSKNFDEVQSILPTIQPDDLESEYKAYLLKNIQDYLIGSKFVFSKSMSEQQQNNMIWVRTTHTDDFEPSMEYRVYINVKPSKILESAKFIAWILSDFLLKNPQIAPYLYFKYKFRALLSESDRADTGILYLKFRPSIKDHMEKILEVILRRVKDIPPDYLNNLASPLLKKLKEGITFVDDSVITDKNQSYTSQISQVFFESLNNFSGKKPSSQKEMQELANNIIAECLRELRKRRYEV